MRNSRNEMKIKNLKKAQEMFNATNHHSFIIKQRQHFQCKCFSALLFLQKRARNTNCFGPLTQHMLITFYSFIRTRHCVPVPLYQ